MKRSTVSYQQRYGLLQHVATATARTRRYAGTRRPLSPEASGLGLSLSLPLPLNRLVRVFALLALDRPIISGSRLSARPALLASSLGFKADSPSLFSCAGTKPFWPAVASPCAP
ncbi:hypothetical protein VTN00DRAFT_3773 [Thermoascus crustaceus]|uniref:uncharacterized protein n=1 Tax=Thermoascus crustaceus TaxID=5088 RepID=UPI003743A58E